MVRDAVQHINIAFKTLCVQGKGKDYRGRHLVAPSRLLSLDSHFVGDRPGNLNSHKTKVDAAIRKNISTVLLGMLGHDEVLLQPAAKDPCCRQS